MNTPNTPRSPLSAPNPSNWKIPKSLQGISAVTLSAIAACVGTQEAPKQAVQAPIDAVRPAENLEQHREKEGDHHENGKLPENVKEKHRENLLAAKELKEKDVQTYFDAMQKNDPFLVPEESVPEIEICCIDGRHGSGKNFPVAGVGVLLRNEQLEVMARNTIELAKGKYDRLRQPIIIRIRPHLEGQCGAAALARKLRGEKDMSPKAVDKEAMDGADRTAKRISELAEGVVPVKVIVEPFDKKNFYNDPNHPELGMLVNGTDMVINGDRKKGPMLFNVSTKLAGEQVATDDAILSGVIALLSHHGMHESAQGIPKGTPFRIIFAGTKEDSARLKAKAENILRDHKDLGPYLQKGGIVVGTWIPQDEQPKKQSWADPLKKQLGIEQLPLNRDARRRNASIERKAA